MNDLTEKRYTIFGQLIREQHDCTAGFHRNRIQQIDSAFVTQFQNSGFPLRTQYVNLIAIVDGSQNISEIAEPSELKFRANYSEHEF